MATEIFDEYRNRLERRRRHKDTIYNFDRASNHFVAWCTERNLEPAEVAPIVMEEYFDELELAPSTKGLYLRQLRAAYTYALARGVIQRDPTIDVELPSEGDKKVRVVPITHLKTAKACITSEAHYLMFHMFAYTGARLHEVLKMTWEDINVPERTIEIIGKGAKRRLVPIHPALGELLKGGTGLVFSGRYAGKQMSMTAAYNWLDVILPGYTFHDFRRTVASSLDANGVSQSEIDEIMGWAPKTVFARHYRNVAPARLQQAILRLYADDPL